MSPPRRVVIWLVVCLLTHSLTAYKLTDTQKKELLDAHNTLRSWRHATDMRLMRWDCRLERWAANHLKTCRDKFGKSKDRYNDTTRQLTGFDQIAESVSWNPSRWTHDSLDYWNLTKIVQTHFYEEDREKFSWSDFPCRGDTSCYVYTQTVWADTYAMGCAVSRCFNRDWIKDLPNRPDKSWMHLSCNYGRIGNWYSHDPLGCPYMPNANITDKKCVYSGKRPWAGPEPCAGCFDQKQGGDWPEQKAIQWTKHCIKGMCSDTPQPPPLPTCSDIPDTEDYPGHLYNRSGATPTVRGSLAVCLVAVVLLVLM